VDRGRYTCLVDEDRRTEHLVTAMRARELGRRAIAVGDRVDLVGDISGRPDTLARIVRIGERTSVLRRSADDTDPSERVLVANADALLIVVAVANPPPRTGFIDRCLVAAYTGHLEPVLLLTKADLADPAALLAAYAELDLPVLVTRREEGSRRLAADSVNAVRTELAGRVCALIGHSGVGKSTLVNALVPDADRATGTVTGVGKGRHTSSSAVALRLPGGGWIIDTPGVRSFGLAHVTADDVLESFDDLLPATANCPPGCDHAAPGLGCALDDLVARGEASPGRLESFRRLLASRGDAESGAAAESGTADPAGAGPGTTDPTAEPATTGPTAESATTDPIGSESAADPEQDTDSGRPDQG
jgi:ribosome biogenesis GTPase